MAVVLACASLLAVAALTLLTPDSLVWPSHIAILVFAAYASLSSGVGPRRRLLVLAAVWPALVTSTARTFYIPMASMLSRLPELHQGDSLPPLWVKGGIALLPIASFSLVQAWLVVRLAHVATSRRLRRSTASLLAAGLVTAIGVVAFLVASVVGVVFAGVSADAGLFPRKRDAYFGLFWMSVTLGLLQPLAAFVGGLLIQRWVSGHPTRAAGDVARIG